jgi:Protein of unknown function (DUF3309)
MESGKVFVQRTCSLFCLALCQRERIQGEGLFLRLPQFDSSPSRLLDRGGEEAVAAVAGTKKSIHILMRLRSLGNMSTRTLLLIILILLLIGALPTWPYSGGWGYYPTGGIGLVLLIVLILWLLGVV